VHRDPVRGNSQPITLCGPVTWHSWPAGSMGPLALSRGPVLARLEKGQHLVGAIAADTGVPN